MNINKYFSKRYLMPNTRLFRERYQYDIKFNASFREKDVLSSNDKSSFEIKYLKYYRACQACYKTVWFKPVYKKLKKFSLKTGIGLYNNLTIGKGLIIGHAGTIVLNADTVFGENIFITHGVTIGRDIRGKRKGSPTIGNNVCIRTNSTIVGKVFIGNDVLIAPNTFVNFDVPSHSIVIGNPAKIHLRENATEGHLGKI